MPESDSNAEIRQFKAALVHNPRLALRRLCGDPLRFLPIAFEAAQFADVREGQRIARVLERLLSRENPRTMARLLFDGIPHGVPILSAVAIEAGLLLAARLQIRTESDRLAKAEIWNGLAERYAAAGDSRTGWRCSLRAVRLMRRLVSEDRDHLPRLIIALQVLAKRCSEIGDHSRAVHLAEDAASRALAASCDISSLRRYIGTLDVLSNRLSMAGDDVAALAEALKAEALARDAVHQGAPFLAEQAVCELRLATTYTRLRQFEQSLPFAERAAAGLQSLAHQDPQAYANLYWNAVDLVVGAHASLGLEPSSDAIIGDARSYFHQLAKDFPAAYLPRFMMYLVRESAALAGPIASDEAVTRGEEASAAAKQVSVLHGDLYCVDEGHIHFHLARLRESRGEWDLAQNSVRNALSCFKRTARAARKSQEWIDEAAVLDEQLASHILSSKRQA